MMRSTWLAQLDKVRPVLLLTREQVRAVREQLAAASIASTVRGLSSEITVGPRNGLNHESALNRDLIATILRDALIRPICHLLLDQELELSRALHLAFDLED